MEGELKDTKLEYDAEIEAMKTATEEAKLDMEGDLKKIKRKIGNTLKSAIAKVQAELGKSQQIQFELSNAIAAVNRKYRDEKNKIYRGCQQEAAEKLSTYRKARRAAIRAGRFKQESISQMLQMNRVTFAQKDDARFVRYYNRCIARNRYLFQSHKEDLGDGLKAIEQKKAIILSQFKSMESQLISLNKEAMEREQRSIQEYSTQLGRIISRHQKEFAARTKAYAQNGMVLNKQLSEKTLGIFKTQGVLQETKNKYNHNREMYNRLRASGASSEDKSSQLGDASGKYTSLKEEWVNAYDVCECGGEEKSTEKECDRIERVGKMVEPLHDNFTRYTPKKRTTTPTDSEEDRGDP